jgi:hypothetical protein
MHNGVGKEACSEHDEIRFQDDVESAVAEFRYQAAKALVMANPPMPTPMPIGRRSQTGPVGSCTLSGKQAPPVVTLIVGMEVPRHG